MAGYRKGQEVSGRRRSGLQKRQSLPSLHHTILVEKSALKHKMLSKKSTLASDETVKSARLQKRKDVPNFSCVR